MKSPVREACPEEEVAISLHAAGALEADEVAKLMAHLQGCAPCRSVLASSARALGLARLPPVSESERRALSDLPDRVLGDLRGRIGRRRLVFRVSTLAAAAAAILVALASPVLLRKPLDKTVAVTQPMAAAETRPLEVVAQNDWQPDLDELWNASDALDVDSTEAQGSMDEAVVGSYDASLGD